MSRKRSVYDSVIRRNALREDDFGGQSSKRLSGGGIHTETRRTPFLQRQAETMIRAVFGEGGFDCLQDILRFGRTNMKSTRIRRDGRPWGRKGSVLKALQIRNLKVDLPATEIASRLLEQQEPPDPGRRIVSSPRD